MKNKLPLVSVVTPVYNTERYLDECIQSVLSQTYKNIEYIIVDNCSTDSSYDIAKRYQEMDDRIRLFRNDELLPPRKNWNHSLQYLSNESKYCKIVHADDWIYPECLEKMVAVAEKSSRIGIVAAYRLEENLISLAGLPYGKECYKGGDAGMMQLQENGLNLFGSPTSLLIRSEIIRNRVPFYDETIPYADTAVCFDILQEYDYGFIHQVLTFTRRHNESLTTSLSLKNDLNVFAGFKLLITYGKIYLKENEYYSLLQKKRWKYHRFLARKIFERKPLDYFKFHFKELRNIGYPVSLFLLFISLLYESLNLRETGRRLFLSFRFNNK